MGKLKEIAYERICASGSPNRIRRRSADDVEKLEGSYTLVKGETTSTVSAGRLFHSLARDL